MDAVEFAPSQVIGPLKMIISFSTDLFNANASCCVCHSETTIKLRDEDLFGILVLSIAFSLIVSIDYVVYGIYCYYPDIFAATLQPAQRKQTFFFANCCPLFILSRYCDCSVPFNSSIYAQFWCIVCKKNAIRMRITVGEEDRERKGKPKVMPVWQTKQQMRLTSTKVKRTREWVTGTK